MNTPYTLRSYAFLFNADGCFILLKEHINNKDYVKLPGGGLECLETPIMAVKRELSEELGLEQPDLSLVHVTEKQVYSAFAERELVLGFYYFGSLDPTRKVSSLEGADVIFCPPANLVAMLDFETDKEAAQSLLSDSRFSF